MRRQRGADLDCVLDKGVCGVASGVARVASNVVEEAGDTKLCKLVFCRMGKGNISWVFAERCNGS